MTTSKQVCEKITEVFPEIGVCGIDLNVNYDENAKAFAVDLTKDDHHLKTFLEINEADSCVEGNQCVSLGLQVGQLKENIEKMTSF